MLAQLGLSRLQLEEAADTPDVDVPVVGGAAGPSTPVGLASGSPAAALELDLHSSPSPSQSEQQPKPPPARLAWDPEPVRQELADQIYAQMLLRETEVRQWVPSGGAAAPPITCWPAPRSGRPAAGQPAAVELHAGRGKQAAVQLGRGSPPPPALFFWQA